MRSLVCLSPSSAFAPPCLMSGSYDRTIKLWELCEGECQCVGSLGTRGSVWTMAVHEGLLLGAIGDSSIKARPQLGLGLGVGAGDGVRGSLGSDG